MEIVIEEIIYLQKAYIFNNSTEMAFLNDWKLKDFYIFKYPSFSKIEMSLRLPILWHFLEKFLNIVTVNFILMMSEEVSDDVCRVKNKMFKVCKQARGWVLGDRGGQER